MYIYIYVYGRTQNMSWVLSWAMNELDGTMKRVCFKLTQSGQFCRKFPTTYLCRQRVMNDINQTISTPHVF